MLSVLTHNYDGMYTHKVDFGSVQFPMVQSSLTHDNCSYQAWSSNETGQADGQVYVEHIHLTH